MRRFGLALALVCVPLTAVAQAAPNPTDVLISSIQADWNSMLTSTGHVSDSVTRLVALFKEQQAREANLERYWKEYVEGLTAKHE